MKKLYTENYCLRENFEMQMMYFVFCKYFLSDRV